MPALHISAEDYALVQRAVETAHAAAFRARDIAAEDAFYLLARTLETAYGDPYTVFLVSPDSGSCEADRLRVFRVAAADRDEAIRRAHEIVAGELAEDTSPEAVAAHYDDAVSDYAVLTVLAGFVEEAPACV